MVFKRFKTFVLEYMTMDHRLQDVRLVYYLDVDIVVAKPMHEFFRGLEERYAIGMAENDDNDNSNNNNTTTTTNATTSTIWMFEGNAKKFRFKVGKWYWTFTNRQGV